MKMEQVMLDRSVDSYLGVYRDIMGRVNNSDVALAVLHELGKDSRMRAIQEKENSSRGNDSNAQATEKQKAYLRYLGVNFDENISKGAASKLIDENVGEGA
jgi:hypothetical protein